MTTKSKTTRGFLTSCPKCGEENSLTLNVSDVYSLTCSSCEAETTAEELRVMIAEWTAMLAWLDAAPVIATE